MNGNYALWLSALGMLGTASGALIAFTWRLAALLTKFEAKTERYEEAAANARRVPALEARLTAVETNHNALSERSMEQAQRIARLEGMKE